MKKEWKKIVALLLFTIITIFGINEITVVKADEHISLNRTTLPLGINSSTTIVVDVPSNLKNSVVSWSSSDKKVATVSSGGVITGLSIGTSVITAAVGDQRATCFVTVNNGYIKVNGISLNKSSTSLFIGSSETLSVYFNPTNSTDKYVSWSSNNPNIASVYNGTITAKSGGSTIITATSGNKLATCNVTVIDNVKLNGIKLNISETTIKEQSSATISVIFSPANATNKKVTWKTSDSGTVSVDASGKITGLKSGSATISAISNDGGYVATAKVNVTEISKAIESISLNKKKLSLMVGQDELLSVSYKPTYAENKDVSWKSSDRDIATVSNGKIVAVSAGSATITVTSDDGKKTDTCEVTVTSAPIKSISFAEETTTIYVGKSSKLKTISVPTGSAIVNPAWTSSDETIVSVANGTVTGKKIGSATISVSNSDGSIKASTNVKVVKEPAESLMITIKNHDIKFDPNVKSYDLTINFENKLDITTNAKNVTINGNQNLKNGSVITITVNDEKKVTYLLNIKKNDQITIYFIGAISLLLLANIIRILVKNKKRKSEIF